MTASPIDRNALGDGDGVLASGVRESGREQGAGNRARRWRDGGSRAGDLFVGETHVMALVDAAGDVAGEYRYGPYGQTRTAAETGIGNPFRFSTKFLETAFASENETLSFGGGLDLYDYGFRWHHAGLGRWTSRDPIGQLASRNLYAYVANNTTSLVDIHGFRDYKRGSGPPPDPEYSMGSGTHGRWSAQAQTKKARKTYRWAKKNAIEYSTKWPNAAIHLDHYLGNSGREYWIDVKDLLTCEGANEGERFLEELDRALQAAESLDHGDNAVDEFSIISQRFTSLEVTEGESQDWYHAMHWYGAYGKGHVLVERSLGACDCETEYSMWFEYHIHDYYNWEWGWGIGHSVFRVSDSKMGSLHAYGLAREFELRGQVDVYIVWKKGQRVHSGADLRRLTYSKVGPGGMSAPDAPGEPELQIDDPLAGHTAPAPVPASPDGTH